MAGRKQLEEDRQLLDLLEQYQPHAPTVSTPVGGVIGWQGPSVEERRLEDDVLLLMIVGVD
jgi:hypothetical protein